MLNKWGKCEEKTWEPIEVINKDDPVILAKYAVLKVLIDQNCWNWGK